jgi:phenylpyruvate tautomerase PptA (4-oxalocrotonate tautomerase family)
MPFKRAIADTIAKHWKEFLKKASSSIEVHTEMREGADWGPQHQVCEASPYGLYLSTICSFHALRAWKK